MMRLMMRPMMMIIMLPVAARLQLLSASAVSLGNLISLDNL